MQRRRSHQKRYISIQIPAKTQCVTFGGNSPKQFNLAIGAEHLSWCTKLKYLGCIFVVGSCEIDISPSVGKFFAQFNNIMQS